MYNQNSETCCHLCVSRAVKNNKGTDRPCGECITFSGWHKGFQEDKEAIEMVEWAREKLVLLMVHNNEFKWFKYHLNCLDIIYEKELGYVEYRMNSKNLFLRLDVNLNTVPLNYMLHDLYGEASDREECKNYVWTIGDPLEIKNATESDEDEIDDEDLDHGMSWGKNTDPTFGIKG